MAYKVTLKQFDGPLDLLLTLISAAKIRIEDIFISEITEQYLSYMEQVDDLDMDSASEFLQMASTLIEIKSRAMLPKPPKVEDEEGLSPEEVLIKQLKEYKLFKEATERMKTLEDGAMNLITKLPDEFPLPPQEFELTGLTVDRLTSAFLRVLRRVEEREAGAPPRRIQRDSFTVADCMRRIKRRLKSGAVRFEELFDGAVTRSEYITMFMAMLEMVKDGAVLVAQEDNFGEIFIKTRVHGDINWN